MAQTSESSSHRIAYRKFCLTANRSSPPQSIRMRVENNMAPKRMEAGQRSADSSVSLRAATKRAACSIEFDRVPAQIKRCGSVH